MTENSGVTAIMCFSSSAGGMELDAIKLADLLSNDRTVVLLCKTDSHIQQWCDATQKSYPCELVRFGSRTFSPSMLIRVRRILRKYEIKNVIFFGASELKTLYFSFLGFDLNVIVRHGTTKSSTKRDPVHRLIYSCVNYHVALSRHLLNNVKTILPGGQAEFRIITSSYNYNPSIGDVVAETGKRQLRIIHVGRIAPGKGQIEAIIACGELHNRGIDFKLDLLGGIDDMHYMEQLEAVIKRTELGEKINLLGHVSDVSVHMANADLLLFPSYGEGMSNALIESLHYGLVNICFENTVFPEFVEMGFRIILVKDRDQLELNRTLVFVAEHLESEKDKVKNNKALALRYFNADRERDDWNKLLR